MPGGPGYPGAVPQVAGDGRDVVFCVRERGCTHLYSAPLDGGEPRPLVSEPGTVVSGASVAGSQIAVVLSTPTSYGEIAVVDLAGGGLEIRTGYGPDPTEIELFAREEREFTISDGTAVQGWLVRDPEAPSPAAAAARHPRRTAQRVERRRRPDAPLPPGARPRAAGRCCCSTRAAATATARTSTGGSRGLGRVATRTTSSSRSTRSSPKGIADPERLAVTGYSYGGYMTCYLTSRDDRFAAAVAGGVVSDLVSMGGTSDDGAPALRATSSAASRGRSATGTRRCRRSPAWTSVARRRSCSTARPTCAARSARPSSGTPRCASGACRPQLVLYPDASHLFILDGRAVAAASTSTAASSTGWSSTPAHAARARHDSTTRTGSAGSRCWPSGTASPAPQLGILRVGRRCGRAVRRPRTACSTRTTGVEATDRLASSRSARSPRSGRRPSSCSSSTRASSTSTRRSSTCCPSCGSPTPTSPSSVTMRHLLTHTSGIDGDVFTDTGRGDDCLEKYVALLGRGGAEPPARRHLVVLQLRLRRSPGRVIEKLTGRHLGRGDQASGSSRRSG